MTFGIAGADDVLRGHQPLLDRGAIAALEHHRPGDPADRGEQRVVLHVAGADLEDVGVLGHDVDLVGLHHLGDDRQAGPLAGLREVAQRLDAEALERVRARARLEGAAAQDRRAGRLDPVGRLEELVAALHGTGAGHDREAPVADRRVEHPDHRVLGVELARGELERPADRRDSLHARQRAEAAHEHRLARAHLTDDRDDLPFRAEMIERRQPFGQDRALDAEHLGLRGRDGHDDDHPCGSFLDDGETKKQRSCLCFTPAHPVLRISVRKRSCRGAVKVVAVHQCRGH